MARSRSQSAGNRGAPPPGTEVRRRAADTVAAVLGGGRRLEDALHYDDLSREDRALLRELATGTVRWGHRLRVIADGLLDRGLPPAEHRLEALLLLGLYQMIHTRIPQHAAVSATVGAVPGKKAWARRVLNGVLRRFGRESERHLAAADAQGLAVATAHPDWLVAALAEAYPDDWRAILHANNTPGPMTLRVAEDLEAYRQELAVAGITAERVPGVPTAVALADPVPVGSVPGFPEGRVSVQDGAAQLAAPLLEAGGGERVLDACSAPGGKLAHILALVPRARMVAVEADAERMTRIRETLARTGRDPEALVHGDATRPQAWWDGEPFDCILVDAPCSGTGVIRRHPDIKHLRRPDDLEPMRARQLALLTALWPLLRPGGRLVYATCSVLPAENTEVVDAFADGQPDAQPEPPALRHGRPAGSGRQILPGEDGMDGFFYAVLNRAMAE